MLWTVPVAPARGTSRKPDFVRPPVLLAVLGIGLLFPLVATAGFETPTSVNLTYSNSMVDGVTYATVTTAGDGNGTVLVVVDVNRSPYSGLGNNFGVNQFAFYVNNIQPLQSSQISVYSAKSSTVDSLPNSEMTDFGQLNTDLNNTSLFTALSGWKFRGGNNNTLDNASEFGQFSYIDCGPGNTSSDPLILKITGINPASSALSGMFGLNSDNYMFAGHIMDFSAKDTQGNTLSSQWVAGPGTAPVPAPQTAFLFGIGTLCVGLGSLLRHRRHQPVVA